METTLVNALPFTVVYGFGPKKGQSEEITYRELDLIEIYTWAKLTKEQRTPDLIVLCTNRTLSWVRTLSLQSAAKLAKSIFELNFPNAALLLEDPVMAALLRPMLQEAAEVIKTLTPEQLEIFEANLRKMSGETGNEQSPTPQPSVSVPATGSDSSGTPPAGSTP